MTQHYARQRTHCPVCNFMRTTVDETGLCGECRGAWFEWNHGPPKRVRIVEVQTRDCYVIADKKGERFYAHPIELCPGTPHRDEGAAR